MPMAVSDPGLLEAAATLSVADPVDLRLVHRQKPSEVFLTDARAVDDRIFVAAAALPGFHPHYTGLVGPDRRTPDLMLLLECCRQAETYAAHAFFAVAPGSAFVLRSWSADLFAGARDATGGAPTALLVTAVTSNLRMHRDRVSGLDYEFDLWVSGAWIGRCRMEVAYLSPGTYTAIRARRRGGPPPTSDAMPAALSGRPADPAQVGRLRATDTVLLDVDPGPASVTARLRIPTENTSYFDHPHDHIPGMVLVEAARQAATLARRTWGGEAPGRTVMVGVESTFRVYAELDRAVTMTAVPGNRSGTVEVTFHQGGTDIARSIVALAAGAAPHGQRQDVAT
jgi:hypothetical protein